MVVAAPRVGLAVSRKTLQSRPWLCNTLIFADASLRDKLCHCAIKYLAILKKVS